MMNDRQFLRSLRTIGVACFVKHYEKFIDLSISNDKATDALVKQEKFTESGSAARVVAARRIIREGRKYDALKYAAKSKRIESEWSRRAQAILKSGNK